MRKKIGVIINYLYEGYQLKVLSGILNTARNYNTDVLVFVGGNLNSDIENIQRNKIYKLITSKNVDGLIILGLVLEYNIPKEKIIQFYKNFVDIPTVSIGIKVKDFPSIITDNSRGFINLLNHLIKDHKYKNFAFVTGPLNNDEAKERYEIFLRVMEENHMEVSSDYIYYGDFSKISGINAIKAFLDERKLKLPDVIVFSNDIMAIGGIEELKRRNIKIPEEIAITGFDNIEESYSITPSLTTVDQPLYKLGETALETCLSLTLGEKTREDVILPTKLIIRESCGHKEGTVNIYSPEKEKVKNISEIRKLKKDFLELLEKDLKDKKNYQLPSEIYDFFFTSLFENNQVFLKKIYEYLEKEEPETIEELKEITSSLYLFVQTYLEEDLKKTAENLILTAEKIIKTYSEKLLRYERFKINEETELLGYVGSDLLSSFRMEDILERISIRLPELNINTFYLISTDENLEKRKLIFARLKDRIVQEEISFNSNEIIPQKLYPKERTTLIIKPLYFQESFFGYIVLEYGPKRGVIYEILRSQISAAIQGAKLFEELNQLAITDPLTKLPNRRYIEAEFQKEIERSKRYSSPLSVMVLDLDNFKIINDTFGHQYGDEVLKKIAENLRKYCRKVDIVGRFGGDEFVIILPETNLEKSIKVADKIIKNLEKMNITLPNGEKVYISVSIGIASYPETTKDPEKLLSLADTAMYNAKKLGGKQYSVASF